MAPRRRPGRPGRLGRSGWSAAAVLGLTGVVLAAPPAQAHNDLVATEPAADQVAGTVAGWYDPLAIFWFVASGAGALVGAVLGTVTGALAGEVVTARWLRGGGPARLALRWVVIAVLVGGASAAWANAMISEGFVSSAVVHGGTLGSAAATAVVVLVGARWALPRTSAGSR